MSSLDPTYSSGRYSPPRQDLSPAAMEVVQAAEEFSNRMPMPPSCALTIMQDYMPKYVLWIISAYLKLMVYRFEYLAENCESVRHALVSSAAYTHYQGTKSPVSEATWMHHTSIAMYELQNEIANFSQHNSDSIVTASIALASTAYDW